MVGAARDHTWSSHRANAFGEPDRLVTPHECYQALGRPARIRQAAYRTMFENDLPRETIETLKGCDTARVASGARGVSRPDRGGAGAQGHSTGSRAPKKGRG